MQKYSKFIAALVAALGVLVSSGLLHGTSQLIVTTAIAMIGAAGVYLVPNSNPAPPAPPAA
jgi:hypothetical protein